MTNAPAPRRNRLAREASPYLLRHAADAVDWYPWGEEAFAAARESRRPILLSIGYGASRWCRVMARESFADEATAALMNALFVNVKVDCEERPDIDHLYQSAHVLLTRQPGGWPLTMFLAHEDALPFFGGTYFPREPAQGLPPLCAVLERVAEYYRDQQPALREQNQLLREALAARDAVQPGEDALPDAAPLAAVRQALEQRFDAEHGGWGGAPKFPQPELVLLLLRSWQRSSGQLEPDLMALYLATLTLTRMAAGGLQDAADGGFHRCTKDAAWREPLPEKRLPDNARLLSAYAAAAVATGDEAFAAVANRTAEFLLRDLTGAAPGFAASLTGDPEADGGPAPLATRDDRRLTGWNALAIRGLADAARALQRPELARAAADALAFVRHELWRDGRLRACWHDGQARGQAGLDDHAFLLEATLALQECRVDGAELAFAAALADRLLAAFEAPDGGFHDAAADDALLFHRSRRFDDDALPAGSGVAAQALRRLGLLLGEPRFVAASDRCLRAGWRGLVAQPLGHVALLGALVERLEPPAFVLLRGPAADVADWQRQLQRLYLPGVALLVLPESLDTLPPALAQRAPPRNGDAVTAVVHRGDAAPVAVRSLAQLRDALLDKPAFGGEQPA